jgi:hypothetical protein
LYGDDSPDPPLPPIVVAARVAHPSSPHLCVVDNSSTEDTSVAWSGAPHSDP